MIAGLRIAAWLAWREQAANRRATLCFALALAAMLAPMLTLLALKDGVIERMTEQLTRRPSTLEILPVGAGRYDRAFFESVAAMPWTDFLAPRTRTISARLMAVEATGSRRLLHGPALVPTGPGDPVIAQSAPDYDNREVVLSAEAARQLQATPGDRLIAHVDRQRRGEIERVEVELSVLGVAPAANMGGVAIFAPPELLAAVESFLDGVGAPDAGWLDLSRQVGREAYASFRLYARGLRDVAPLRDALETMGAQVRARTDEIELVLQLERALDWLFAIIASVAGAGFWLALVASLRANVERLRDTLSMFRLLGASGLARFLFPMAQSGIIVLAGAAMAAAAYVGISAFVDLRARDLLGDEGELMHLGGRAIAATTAVLAVSALAAAVYASRAAVAVGASEVLRRP